MYVFLGFEYEITDLQAKTLKMVNNKYAIRFRIPLLEWFFTIKKEKEKKIYVKYVITFRIESIFTSVTQIVAD